MTWEKYSRWLDYLRAHENLVDQAVGRALVLGGKFYDTREADGTVPCGACVGAMYYHFFCLEENSGDNVIIDFVAGSNRMARDFLGGTKTDPMHVSNLLDVLSSQLLITIQNIMQRKGVALPPCWKGSSMDADVFSSIRWPVKPLEVFEQYGKDMKAGWEILNEEVE